MGSTRYFRDSILQFCIFEGAVSYGVCERFRLPWHVIHFELRLDALLGWFSNGFLTSLQCLSRWKPLQGFDFAFQISLERSSIAVVSCTESICSSGTGPHS